MKKKILKKLIFILIPVIFIGVTGAIIFSRPEQATEAQAAVEYLRPTAYTDSARKTTNPRNAFDGAGSATFSSTAYGVTKNPSIVFFNWQTTNEVYTSSFLKVRYHADAGKDDTYAIAYSTNGCAGTFVNLVAPTSAAAVETTVSSPDLGPTANLSKLCLKIYTVRGVKDDGKKLYLHDIWTEGAFTLKDSDGNLTSGASVAEPVALSSLVDTEAEKTALMDFTISDGGSADGLPLTVNRLTLHTSGTGDFNDLVWQLNGPGVNYVSGMVGENVIIFNNLNLVVPNGSASVYTVYAYFKPAVVTADGGTYRLWLDGDTDLAVNASGTQIGATSAVDNGAGSVRQVLATKIIFSAQPPAVVAVNFDFPGTVTVSAVDENNYLDLDFVENISLTAVLPADQSLANGFLSSTEGLTKTAVAGTAGWTNLSYDSAEVINLKAVSDTSFTGGIYSTAVSVQAPSDWWNAAWSQRQKLTFNNSGQAENLTDFPVLVTLNAANFNFAQAQADGQDIRFLDSDNATELKYEIEYWNALAQEAVIWVKVPQINDSSSADYIYLYFGNSLAPDNQLPTEVWTNGYEAVYHFAEQSGYYQDSTAGNHDADSQIITSRANTDSAGIGYYPQYNGTTDYIRIPDSDSLDFGTSDFTILVRAKPNVANLTDTDLMRKGSTGADTNSWWKIEWGDDTGTNNNNVHYLIRVNPTDYTVSYPLTPDGKWHNFWGTRNTATARIELFVDGASVRETAGSSGSVSNSSNLGIGAKDTCPTVMDDQMIGNLDEVRLSKKLRSDAWIAAENKSLNNSLVVVGTVETY